MPTVNPHPDRFLGSGIQSQMNCVWTRPMTIAVIQIDHQQ